MRRWLGERNVLVEDGGRTLYLDCSINEYRERQKIERKAQDRFVSWLNGQYKKLGIPLTTREEFNAI